ncbi:MAG: carboxy terminal-processing peptidase [Kiritimatiellae bacterium]|nr:carboxy terminal-processing peptidase [Kiritimatiellia bacterium]
METKTTAALFAVACLAAAAAAADLAPRNYDGRIAERLVNTLTKMHVLQRVADDEISRRAWTNLVSYYDFDHSVFLQEDLDRLAPRQTTLDDELKAGDAAFGFEVYNLYVRRLAERLAFATNLLAAAEFDFSTNETYRVRRKDAPWPATTAEAEDHWRRRMKNEVLSILVNQDLDAAKNASTTNAVAATNDVAVATNEVVAATNRVGAIAADLIKKYRQYAVVMTEPDEEAVLQRYLSAFCHAYDPHTDYMSPTTREDFDMEMNLTLCGIGATLSMDDGALKILEIMPGSPCDRDGRIKRGDKIVGVQQGGGEMEDIMWQPMKKSIKKIRGPKGTRVTLEIIPRSDPTGATKKLIDLVRDEIKLEDQAATGRVEVVALGGVTNRLGYIDLPGFYGTFEKRPFEDGYRSCSMDVAKLIADFNAEGVAGLVLDLRGNGGGSLREAVMLSALFVPSGPVVQIRDVRQTGCLPVPPGNPVAFRRPLVVLVDRASASASEIVAGHLQDTGRAVVIGDRCTHGKGTVQTVSGLGPDKYGSCKVTTARFYRIDGRSTQLQGVSSDIHLPSLLDSLDVGEDKLTYALPFSQIAPADYRLAWNMHSYVPELRRLSGLRLEDNTRYLRHVENVKGMKELSEREEVPLEYAARRKMAEADRALRDLDDGIGDVDEDEAAAEVAAGDGDDAGDDDKDEDRPARRRRGGHPRDDVVLEESFNVLMDIVRMTHGEEIPQPKGWWF